MPSKQAMENLGNKFAEISIQYRWLVIIASIAISVAISYGAANLKFAPDYRVFFGAEIPSKIRAVKPTT
ncbi:hypothetical protein ACFO4O_02220 [Glaciecola siphonariae]|uniref:Uncharacterized protein n=1 Tax=Glaciecola siphonariae TaxID=521012 RepID=A0ABV9LR49_9ALTE